MMCLINLFVQVQLGRGRDDLETLSQTGSSTLLSATYGDSQSVEFLLAEHCDVRDFESTSDGAAPRP